MAFLRALVRKRTGSYTRGGPAGPSPSAERCGWPGHLGVSDYQLDQEVPYSLRFVAVRSFGPRLCNRNHHFVELGASSEHGCEHSRAAAQLTHLSEAQSDFPAAHRRLSPLIGTFQVANETATIVRSAALLRRIYPVNHLSNSYTTPFCHLLTHLPYYNYRNELRRKGRQGLRGSRRPQVPQDPHHPHLPQRQEPREGSVYNLAGPLLLSQSMEMDMAVRGGRRERKKIAFVVWPARDSMRWSRAIAEKPWV